MSNFSFAKGLYSFDWDAEPHLNSPALDSPIPCRSGYNCTYSGVCSFVHPGEEGIGRRIFAARNPSEKDVVRLFGVPEKKATFYERRRLRLSWSQWCEKVGWAAPVASSTSSYSRPPTNGRRRERIQLGPSASQTISSITEVAKQMTLPMLQVDFSNPECVKNYIGDFLYIAIELRINTPESQEIMKSMGWSATPGKITGVLLASLDIPDLQLLMTNDTLLNEYIIDVFVTLKQQKENQN